MPSQVIFLVAILIYILSSVQSDSLLFRQGYIKFAKYGKRFLYFNVEHIDNKLLNDNKRLILVKTKSLTVLHSEAVRNLTILQDIIMAKCNIRKVENNAFFNLPNLTSIHLQDNHLREIKQGVFNGLPIKILSLQRNIIKKIDSHAFDDMPNLYKIKMNSNRLKEWDSNWFQNSPKLTELYFRRNKLNYLPPYSFANIEGSHVLNGNLVVDTKIFLSRNKLSKITPASFHNLKKISQLYLDRNNISEIPDEAFRDLEEIDLIYLARNKIHEIKEKAFPKVKKIGFLDLSGNLLKCLPYKLVSIANQTNLEQNNGTCQCVSNYEMRLLQENKSNEITYDHCNI
ncbi:LRR 8 domain containing protein [Asbolus verrucosus]|uniref:LRR 8 domain containing protein n=1 Tax=Asbolus verrucosus TaxID=1661398 RepID=A0A482VZC2_ASBVE|nr:LRR 8 domain containing protein [Asbolus verrucosus]